MDKYNLSPSPLCLSMATLKEMFELELPMVHSIISKMIINEELMVKPTASVISKGCALSCVDVQPHRFN